MMAGRKKDSVCLRNSREGREFFVLGGPPLAGVHYGMSPNSALNQTVIRQENRPG